MNGEILWIIIATVLIAISMLLYSRNRRKSQSEELLRIIAEIRTMSEGNLDRPQIENKYNDPQLAELAEAVNALAIKTRNDVADMKRLERVRSEFLGNVSHELRTPIFSVQGFLETLMDGAIDDVNVRDDFLKKAHFNVMRLHTLLNDLIEISRIESGEMKMRFRYFDAKEFFGNIVEELRPTAEIAGIHLEFQVQGSKTDDPMVYGDRDRLKQVMANLIENAIKYNRPDGSVMINVDLQSDRACISVSDTGIGIPTEDIERIFERFYRVSKDRSRAVGGSGLGLAIVKHIIEAHDSHVDVRSVPGEGTTFSFNLKR